MGTHADGAARNAADETESRVTAAAPLLDHISIEGYEIIRELHRGGQGVVYEALQRSTKRKVAIKLLVGGRYAPKTAKKRFEREIELIAQLKHPNIISIFHSGVTADGMQLYVMDYVRGLPLHQHVRDKKLSMEEALQLFSTVCEAIQYAHQRGVIHRDLKPTNVLVDAEGNTKVLDFGLAKLLAGPVDTVVSVTQNVIGTLPYMSPEQARGNPDEIDTRTDVYALGVILYELLTGHYPYPVVGQMADILKHIVETPPTPPTRRWTSDSGMTTRSHKRLRIGECPIDDEIQTIVLRALTKERERRYQSAGELGRDLGHYLAGEPIEAKRDSHWYMVKKSLQRYRFPVAVGALFMLVICVGLAVSLGFWHQASVARDVARQSERTAREARAAAEVAREGVAAERDRALDQLYAHQVALADSAHQNLEYDRMTEVLHACAESRRGWEWHWLTKLSRQNLLTFRGHGRWVCSVSFSPDGRYVLSNDWDRMKLWEIDTGRQHRDIDLDSRATQAATFSPTGELIAACDLMGTVHVWDAESLVELRAMTGPSEEMDCIAFSPDGRRLAVGGRNGLVQIWNASTGQGLLRFDTGRGWARCLVFGRDGVRLATGHSNGDLCVWSAETGDELAVAHAHAKGVSALGFDPTGERLASAGRDGTIKLWDASMLDNSRTLYGHDGGVGAVAFSPDGTRLVSGGTDRRVRLWDLGSGSSSVIGGHQGRVDCVAFSPSGQLVASGGYDRCVRLWNPEAKMGPSVVHEGAHQIRSMALGPEGKRIALASDRARVLDALSGHELVEFEEYRGDHRYHWRGRVVAFSPDGRLIASGNGGSTIQVWDAATGEEMLRQLSHENIVCSVAFSPDGRQLAVGCRNNTVTIWDAQSGHPLLTLPGHDDWVQHRPVAFRPDGRAIVSSWHGRVPLKLWDPATGEEIRAFRTSDEHVVLSLSFNHDGTRIATGGWDTTVRVWDVLSGTELLVLRGHGARVESVAFSPDGRRIISGSCDSTIKIWESTTGDELCTLRGHADDVHTLALTRDGHRIVAGHGARLLLWDASPLRPD